MTKPKLTIDFMQEGGPYPIKRVPQHKVGILQFVSDLFGEVEKTIKAEFDVTQEEVDFLMLHILAGGLAVAGTCDKAEMFKRMEFAFDRGIEMRESMETKHAQTEKFMRGLGKKLPPEIAEKFEALLRAQGLEPVAGEPMTFLSDTDLEDLFSGETPKKVEH